MASMAVVDISVEGLLTGERPPSLLIEVGELRCPSSERRGGRVAFIEADNRLSLLGLLMGGGILMLALSVDVLLVSA